MDTSPESSGQIHFSPCRAGDQSCRLDKRASAKMLKLQFSKLAQTEWASPIVSALVMVSTLQFCLTSWKLSALTGRSFVSCSMAGRIQKAKCEMQLSFLRWMLILALADWECQKMPRENCVYLTPLITQVHLYAVWDEERPRNISACSGRGPINRQLPFSAGISGWYCIISKRRGAKFWRT